MINDRGVLLSADTMLVFGHQGQHKYRSDGLTRSVGIMPGEPCRANEHSSQYPRTGPNIGN